jgi:hypothetical protein
LAESVVRLSGLERRVYSDRFFAPDYS